MLLKAWKDFSNRPRPKKLVKLFEKGVIDIASVMPYTTKKGEDCFSWSVRGVGPDGTYRYSPEGPDWDGMSQGVVPHEVTRALGSRPIEAIVASAELLIEHPRPGIKSICGRTPIKKGRWALHSYIERFQSAP